MSHANEASVFVGQQKIMKSSGDPFLRRPGAGSSSPPAGGPAAAFQQAVQCHQAGQLERAEALASYDQALAQLPDVSHGIAQGGAPPGFDYQCPLLSLPLGFRTELASVPPPPANLFADEQRIPLWQSRLGGTALPRVGLSWSGSTWHRNDLNRSISLRNFQQLCMPGIEFVSIQKEVRPADQPLLDAMPDMRRFSAELTDFAETAALLACLVLVVCVDTGGAVSRRRPRAPGMAAGPVHPRLALVAQPRRQPLVPHGAPAPPAEGRRLGQRHRTRRQRTLVGGESPTTS